MRIGFDVAQTCAQRAGCGWYADSLVRAMVEVAPENGDFLYHQFGRKINEDTTPGTFLKQSFWLAVGSMEPRPRKLM